MKLKTQAAYIPKRNIDNDESKFSKLYPNITYFREKYCDDCCKDCVFPSMEVFSCMLKKLSNKKNKKDGQK